MVANPMETNRIPWTEGLSPRGPKNVDLITLGHWLDILNICLKTGMILDRWGHLFDMMFWCECHPLLSVQEGNLQLQFRVVT